MKTTKYILISTLVVLVFGCTKLDETLYSQLPASVFPENEQQAALITLPIYDRLTGWADWAGYFFLQEVTADAVTCPTRGADWDDGGKWRELHTHTWTGDTEALMQAWPNLYQGIGECNKLADQLKGSSNPIDQLNYARVLAMRAYYYYCLIDLYGDVPYVTSFANAPNLPYRNHRKNIFDSIVNDLKWAYAHLPEGRGNRIAVNKGMVFSLLAKLFINAEVWTGTPRWAEAEAYADSVIKLGYTLDPNIRGPFLTNNRGTPENIFVVDYDRNLKRGFNLHMRTLHYSSDQTFGMVVGPWNGFCFMPAFFNSYEANDLRKDAWFLYGPQFTIDGAPLMDGVTGEQVNFTNHIPSLTMSTADGAHVLRNSGVRANKFEVARGAGQDLSNQFPIFRFADILLIKAEARVRQGLNGDTYVNMIRQRAGVSNFNGTTLDQILAERGREMVWEAHRRQDLIRFGRFGDAWWEKPASDASRRVFDIPRQQIDVNPNLALPPR